MHILLLEDDNPLREVLKLVLISSRPELTIHQFANGDSALGHIQAYAQEIDLYVLDIRVPGELNGMALAREIRELGYDTPIVITSAYRRPNLKELDSLNCVWMPKPWKIKAATEQLLPLAQQYYEARPTASV